MSLNGRLTHLQIVVNGSLLVSSGLRINTTASGYQGSWTPSSYSQGSLTSATFLNNITRAIPLAYNLTQGETPPLSIETYRNLISIGQGVSPALGNSRPPSFTQTPSGWVTSWPNASNGYNYARYGQTTGDVYLINGFLATIARQAYYEFYSGSGVSQYKNTIKSILLNYSWKNNRNRLVGTYVNSKTYLSQSFGGLNDLTSAGVSSVNPNFKNFGNDLILSGKVIDLSNLNLFGTPSILLKTLKKYGGITGALGLLLIVNGLTGSEVAGISGGTLRPTADQEKKIYNSFVGLIGEDLDEVKTIMNIGTSGLVNLADLLNPRKLLPTSYTTLTTPVYQDPTTNNGVDRALIPIYSGSGVNPQLRSGSYLVGILPDDVAIAARAFGISMSQINNIKQLQIEKISQSIYNLQTVGGNLLTPSTNGIANSLPVVTNVLNSIAQGGGSNGSYRMADFFGAMSGVSYNTPYELLNEIFIGNAATFNSLNTIYTNIYNLVNGGGPYDNLQTLIDQANAEILRIRNINQSLIEQVNTYWNIIGTNLYREQLAIITAVPDQEAVTTGTSEIDDYDNFVSSFNTYVMDSGIWEIKQVLINIADITTQGGQALVAALTEAQNEEILAISGSMTNAGIPQTTNVEQASAEVILDDDGKIMEIIVTNGGAGYNKQSCACCMPDVFIEGGLTTAIASVDMDIGEVTKITVTSGGNMIYSNPPPVTISPAAIPLTQQPLGGPVEAGSFAGGLPDTIPENLRSV